MLYACMEGKMGGRMYVRALIVMRADDEDG